MQTYVVQQRDFAPIHVNTQQGVASYVDPALRIALHFTGCPKCVLALVYANPMRARVQYPNGFITFQELRPGDVIYLPDPWFDGTNKSINKDHWAWPQGWDANWQQYVRY